MTQNDLTIYRDGDRYIIGRAAWQTCYSMTYGVADAYSRSELRAAVAYVRGLTLAQIDAAKRTFWTDSRFDVACAKGLFGPDWD